MLQVMDSLSKKVLRFKPLEKGVVKMYNCGPTVYGYVHIGNLRYFLFTDLLRRYLGFSGYAVTQIMNITDVGHMLADADEGEDKIEMRAKEEGKTPQEIATFYTEAFFRDIDRLGIVHATHFSRASEHVPEMIAMIEKLLANGHAYRVGHNVYYDVGSFKKYGKLSGNVIEGLEVGKRIDVREEKKHPADFALWIHNPSHIMQWSAPWGSGYPGWHLECSAMAIKYLGETIDLHTGGEDHFFPHHECEIAQSEGTTRKLFARYWMHVRHLLVDGQKMSKSLGNGYRLDDLIAKGFTPQQVRYLLVSVHYRQPMNFTFPALESAVAACERLEIFAETVKSVEARRGVRQAHAMRAKKAIVAAMDDDLNVSAALAALFDYVRDVNEMIAQKKLTEGEKKGAREVMGMVNAIFGFTFGAEVEVPTSVKVLLEQREMARKERRFVEADRLRNELKDLGWVIDDTPQGARLRRA